MQAVFFLALACLAAGVQAGGYHGCLERIWAFQAYEIDALNSPSDQTLGFSCKKYDDKTKTCVGDWEPCKKKRNAPGRCNFDEFVYHLGKAPKQTGWTILDKKSGRLDIEATAKNCYQMYGFRPGAAPGTPTKVPNFKTHMAMKGTFTDYNDFIIKVGAVVNDVQTREGGGGGGGGDGNKHLYDDFARTTEMINTARAGDHGPYLIREARAQLGNDMEIKVQDLGSNPATGAKWETVDWKATALEAKRRGVPGYEQRIKGFLNGWYHDGSQNKGTSGQESAKSHHQVMRSFKRVAHKARSCRAS